LEMQWPREKGRTENTIAKRKRKGWKYNGQEKKEGLKMEWPREKGRTENTMAKRKRKDWKCNLFLLAIVFSVLSFSLGHCIFSPFVFSWTLYFQPFLFLLAIEFSDLHFSLGLCIFI
jgi:Ca2+-dependent lipid-binding protein